MNQTRKLILGVALALSSLAAHATIFSGASGYDKKQDDKIEQLQDRDSQLAADIHAVHMNTLTKYSESWGLEDRANIAKLQEDKLDKSVFAADQQRQDKALADAVSKQAVTDSKQSTDLKGYADAKATSAYQTSVAHTDAKVARADADRKAGDDALGQRIDTTTAAQAERDAGQDTHINAVQGAAQAANEKADAGAVRMDGIEQQAGVLDGRVGQTEVRLDTVEGGVRETNAQLTTDRQNTAAAISNEATIRGSQVLNLTARTDLAFRNAEANAQAIRNTNAVVNQHSEQLANHEQRLGALEQQGNRNYSDLRGRIDRVQNKANAGTAAALSAASIPQVTEYQTFALGAGAGGYEGESALAVGFSSRVSTNVVIKASVTTDSQHGTGYAGGVSVGW